MVEIFEDPSLAIPYTLIVDPMRTNDRNAIAEPRCTKSRILRLDPSFEMPKDESVEPKRTKLRRLIVDPRRT